MERIGSETRLHVLLASSLIAQPLIILLAISTGSLHIPLSDVLRILMDGRGEGIASTVLWTVRIPRTLAAAVGGAGLAAAGVILQVFFRNPLADPYILGVSSGSSLFIALAILAGATFGLASSPFDPYLLFTASLIGAALVSSLMVSASSMVRSMTTILIIGLMVSYAASAITSILQSITELERLRAFIFWVLGSFAGVKWIHLNVVGVVIILSIAASALLAKPLNALLLSDDYARSVGVNIAAVRVSSIAVASAMTAGVTVLAGPVGFIGLAVPYIARLLSQTSDNRVLIPLAALLGSVITVLADIAARTLLAPVELPVSSITSIFGVPIVLLLLTRRRVA